MPLTRAAWCSAAAALLCAAMAACSSSSPTGPGPGPSPGFDPAQFLRPGSYRLLVLPTSQQISDCTPSDGQSPFFALAAVVTITRDGDTWTARSPTEADGNLELRLRGVGDRTLGNPVLMIEVEGTARGSAMAGTAGGTTQSATFGSEESRLQGRALFQGSAQGTATGTIRLNSPIFGAFECPAVSWTLLAAAPAIQP